MSYKNPDSRRVWGVFYQDEHGDWHAEFFAHDEQVNELEESCEGRGFHAVYLPDYQLIKPFRWAGAICEGTLRPEDLMPKFIEVLDDLDPGKVAYLCDAHPVWFRLIGRARNNLGFDRDDPESVSELMERLSDELQDAAPEGYVFGGHEGDPASIGFWRVESEDEGCYSDHNEDIRTKGSCDYCRGMEMQ